MHSSTQIWAKLLYRKRDRCRPSCFLNLEEEWEVAELTTSKGKLLFEEGVDKKWLQKLATAVLEQSWNAHKNVNLDVPIWVYSCINPIKGGVLIIVRKCRTYWIEMELSEQAGMFALGSFTPTFLSTKCPIEKYSNDKVS